MGWRAVEREYDDEVLGRETLSRMFAACAARHADRYAQAYKGGIYDRALVPAGLPAAPDGAFEWLDYRRMHEIVQGLAAGFRALGVSPGDRVGIFANTRMEWAQCDFALLAAGGVVTTVYPSSTEGQVEYLLSDAGAVGVVVENHGMLERVLAVADALDLEFIVSIDRVPGEYQEREIYELGEVYAQGVRDFSAEKYDDWLDSRSPDDLASLIYTSGTTGQPKGVRLTHWNFKSNLDQLRRRVGPHPDRARSIDQTSRVVSFLPLAHVFERLVGHFHMFASGAMVAYAETPESLREDFTAIKPTHGTSVPRVYERIYEAVRTEAADSRLGRRVFPWACGVAREYARTAEPDWWLRLKHRVADVLVFSEVRDGLGGEIEFLASGGGSLPVDLSALYHGMGLPIIEGYGLTETAPIVSSNPPDAPELGTIGPPLSGVDIEIDSSGIDPDEFPAATGEVGELLVAGPNVTDGYWQDPEATGDAFTDGWFSTGDIVEQRADGYLVFHERRATLLVLSTGKNVAPTPIEEALAANQFVNQAMVIGDERPFVGALIVPEYSAVQRWAAANDLELSETPEGVCESSRVRGRFQEIVEQVNAGLEPHERVKEFRLVPDAFTLENGLLTPTLKKKRREIRDYYRDELQELYRGP